MPICPWLICPQRRRIRWVVAAVAAIVVLTAACSDLLGPDRLDPPELQTLSVTDVFAPDLRYGGLFSISARPADTSFRLLRGQRVPVEVTVSSGDRETVGLYRHHCPARERGSGRPCFKFTVIMQEGHRVEDIGDRIVAIGGRFHLFAGGLGGVTMFYPDVVKVAREVGSWPGVHHTAFLSGGGVIMPVTGSFSLSDLRVPMPVDTGTAMPGDGIVQARPGDLLTVTYQQPRGGTIEAGAAFR